MNVCVTLPEGYHLSLLLRISQLLMFVVKTASHNFTSEENHVEAKAFCRCIWWVILLNIHSQKKKKRAKRVRRVSRIHGNDTSKWNPLWISAVRLMVQQITAFYLSAKGIPSTCAVDRTAHVSNYVWPIFYASGTVEPKWKHCGNSYIFLSL